MDENSDDKKENLVQLTANYFRIISGDDWRLHRYTVNFEPEEDSLERQKVLLQEHRDMLGCFLLDGSTLCCARKPPLAFPPDEKCQITAVHLGDMKPGDHRYGNIYYNLGRLIMDSLNLQQLGRHYYDLNNPGAKVPIDSSSLEIWTGYQTAIHEHDCGIVMYVDVMHKVMAQITAFDILEQVMSTFGSEYQEEFQDEIMGIQVWTEYDNKLHRIDDVTYSMTPLSNVTFGDKSLDMTYKEYHKIEHNIDIYHSSQPLLVTRVKGNRWGQMETVYLIPELCVIAGLPSALKRDSAMQEMLASRTALGPKQRMDKLQAFNERIVDNPRMQKELDGLGLKLDSKFLQVIGTVLPPEILTFGDECQVNVGLDGDWAQAFKESSFFNPVKLDNWVVLTPHASAFEAKTFVAEVMKSTRNFQLSEPRYVEIEESTPESYGSHLQKSINNFDPQLMLIVMEGRHRETFNLVMKKCHLENAIPVQVITDKCFVPETQESIATKVAIQLNCKIGGAPWSIHVPLNRLMVVGISVFHDTENPSTSFSTLVATLDKGLTKYFSGVLAHEQNSELTQNIIANLKLALEKFREANDGNLPSRIICYREGVHDRQISHIIQQEVSRIQSSLDKVYAGSDSPVKLAYILVSSFCPTRFFQGSSNPPLGTLVQETITQPLRKDFFLISHKPENDTAIPTYYNIISDSSRLSLERLQILTYKLTHMYFNCSNTVRSPAPLQYAFKLARRVGQSIHAPPDRKLQDRLYYL